MRSDLGNTPRPWFLQKRKHREKKRNQRAQTYLQVLDEPPVEPQMIATLARQRLIDDIRIDELSLRKLAQDRALEIKGHLLQQQIPDERIFLLDVELVDNSDEDTSRANLTLDGR